MNYAVTAGDTTLQADEFKSDWAQTVAPDANQVGTITFPGQLPNTATTADLRFATVFNQGFKGPKRMSLTGLPLHPVAAS